jgi:predicted AAA+ superfamily ATPase
LTSMVTSEPPSGVTLRFAQCEVEAGLADTLTTVLQGARRVGQSTLAKTATAGRAETVVLYGFSQGELACNREDFVDRAMAGDIANLLGREGALVRRDYLELACAGSYPEPLTRSGRRRNAWFNN